MQPSAHWARTMAKSGNRDGRKAARTDLDGLKALLARAGEGRRGPAPVEKWNPEPGGDLDMEIRADGSWHYLGTPIARQALVDLFATVLRKDEDGQTWLVTPVERYRIRVADAHFIAVEMHVSGEGGGQILTFRTNTGDVIEAGPDNPLRFEIIEPDGGVKPYLRVRGRLEALLSRPVTHELLSFGEQAEIDGEAVFAVRSHGALFAVMGMAELENANSDAREEAEWMQGTDGRVSVRK